jgi:hypothetical protein
MIAVSLAIFNVLSHFVFSREVNRFFVVHVHVLVELVESFNILKDGRNVHFGHFTDKFINVLLKILTNDLLVVFQHLEEFINVQISVTILITISEWSAEFLSVQNSILVSVKKCKEITFLIVAAPVCSVDRLVLIVLTAVVTRVDNGVLEAKAHQFLFESVVENRFVDLTVSAGVTEIKKVRSDVKRFNLTVAVDIKDFPNVSKGNLKFSVLNLWFFNVTKILRSWVVADIHRIVCQE